MREAIDEFLNAMAYERGCVASSRKDYGADLTKLMAFIRTRGRTTWAEVTLTDLVAWLEDFRVRHYADTSLLRYTATVKSFFGWLLENGKIEQSPTDALLPGHKPERLPRVIEERELNALIDAIDGDDFPSVRDRAVVEVLYGSGLRVTELCTLTLHDVDWTAHTLRVFGKGRKERVVPFGTPALKALERYQKARAEFLHRYKRGTLEAERSDRRAPLFLSDSGSPCIRGTIATIVHKRIHAFLPSGTIATPHTLRHSFATHLLDHHAPLLDIRNLLGHASVATTQIYTHVSNSHLKETFNTCFPRH
ncbi:MAG: tyrosine-type recombinase/integrase [Kiritimatiellia bacterium]